MVDPYDPVSLLVLALLSATAAQAEVSPCDPLLVQPTNNPYGYRLRGDRCEGVYVEQVGGEDLSIVSWTESLQAYDLSSARPLLVAVKIPIARPPTPGIYRVEIGATFRTGAVLTKELWLYNPRR